MEKDFKKLAEELRELIGESTPATEVEVVVNSSSLTLHPKGLNRGDVFFHTEIVVDFCRCKRMCNFVSIDYETGKVVCTIY